MDGRGGLAAPNGGESRPYRRGDGGVRDSLPVVEGAGGWAQNYPLITGPTRGWRCRGNAGHEPMVSKSSSGTSAPRSSNPTCAIPRWTAASRRPRWSAHSPTARTKRRWVERGPRPRARGAGHLAAADRSRPRGSIDAHPARARGTRVRPPTPGNRPGPVHPPGPRALERKARRTNSGVVVARRNGPNDALSICVRRL